MAVGSFAPDGTFDAYFDVITVGWSYRKVWFPVPPALVVTGLDGAFCAVGVDVAGLRDRDGVVARLDARGRRCTRCRR